MAALEIFRQRTGGDFPGVAAVADDLIGLCEQREALQRDIDRLLAFVADEAIDLSASVDPTPIVPFTPRSFRDFMLFERHAIDAARGWARKFRPGAARMVGLYETLFRRPPNILKPDKIWYEKPIYYMGSHINIYTEGDELPWPSYTQALDYELELGAVICRPIKDAAPEEALAAIGGFVVVNDLSARDVQFAEMKSVFGPVKAKNFANAIGAEVVTADEVLPHVDGLAATVTVNGDYWGGGDTSGMQHSIGDMIAYASLGERLEPGELLSTGTIPGCSGMEVGRWLSPGDEIEFTLEKVGSLRNRIGSPS